MTHLRPSPVATPRRLFRIAGAVSCAAAAFAAASSASADDRSAIRIAAEIPVVGVVHLFGQGGDETTGLFGVYAAPFQLGVGYQINDNIYAGGRFGFQVQFPENSDAIFQGRFTGRFEYLFGSGKIRPFVGADLGFFGTAFPGFGGTQTYGGFIGSGSGGVHIFLTDSVTLSPNAELAIQRYFDFEVSGVNFIAGVTLGGWIWR